MTSRRDRRARANAAQRTQHIPRPERADLGKPILPTLSPTDSSRVSLAALPVSLPIASSAAVPSIALSAGGADNFWRDLHDREWARRDQLQAAVGVPLTFLTALAGALWYLFQQALGAADLPALSWAPLFIVAFLFAALSFVLATFALILSFLGYTYQTIPYPGSLIAYRDGLRAHYTGLGHSDFRSADDEFRAHVEACYVKAAECNARCNTRRAAWVYRTNVAMAAALLGAAIAAIPVARTMRAYPRAPQPIMIVTPPSPQVLPMSDSPPNNTAPASTPSNQQPAAPPKPEPPQNVNVRSNDTSARPVTKDSGTPKR